MSGGWKLKEITSEMYCKEKQIDPVSFVVDRTDFDLLIYRNQKGFSPSSLFVIAYSTQC